MGQDLTFTKEQVYALEFCIRNNARCGLFLDMGLGKTVIGLELINISLKKNYECFVLSTKSVIEGVWEQEAMKWNRYKHISFSKTVGSSDNKIKALNKKADVKLVSKECLLKRNKDEVCKNSILHDYLVDKDHVRRLIIIDESSIFKNSKSKSSSYDLFSLISHFTYVVLFSGTPTPKNIEDIFGQVKLLDGGSRLGNTITQFRNNFAQNHNGGKYKYNPNLPIYQNKAIYNERSLLKVKNNIKDICLYMDNDVISIDIKYVDFYVNLTPDLRKKYNYLKREKILQNITASTASSVFTKLLQFCNGNVYDELGNSTLFHKLKLIKLQEVLKLYKNQNVIIAYKFKHDLELIKSKINGTSISSSGAKEKWNEGKIPILFVNPASCSHGLNLQYGGSVIIWFSLTFDYEHYTQMNMRLARQGQKDIVHVVHILVNDTAEARVVELLKTKDMNSKLLLTKLKHYLYENK